MPQLRRPRRDLVALVPAAGLASRLGPLAGSKELLPVGHRDDGTLLAAVEPLLERLGAAGADRAYLLLRKGKWDLPAYLGRGERHGLPLAFVALDETASVCETLSLAAPFVRDCNVLLGFPDILFEPPDLLRRVVERHARGDTAAVLGLVPCERPDKADMVAVDATGRVARLEIKPAATRLRLTWIGAVWDPRITALLLSRVRAGYRPDRQRELYPGDLLQAAVDEGLPVAAVTAENGRHLDIGTLDDYARALSVGFVPRGRST
jgi:glucose-1-phosphate thymidylyltransferase